MRLQFTIRRMLLATMMFALVLGLTGNRGGESLPGALLASTAFSGLVLLARMQDITRVIYSVVFTGIGLFIAGIFSPPVMRPGRFTPTDELYLLIVGATGGWILGCVALRFDNYIKSRRIVGDKSK